jgi:hypothetical protein
VSHTPVRTEAGAEALAAVLTDVGRRDPVVVVSSLSRPAWANPDELARRLNVPVYLLTGHEVAWQLSDALPEETGVFGDCVRIYPPGLEWIERPWLADFITRSYAQRPGAPDLVTTLSRSLEAVDARQAREGARAAARAQGSPGAPGATAVPGPPGWTMAPHFAAAVGGSVDADALAQFRRQAVQAEADQAAAEERSKRDEEARSAQLAEQISLQETEALKARVAELEDELAQAVPLAEHHDWVDRVMSAEAGELRAKELMQKESMRSARLARELKDLRTAHRGASFGQGSNRQDSALGHDEEPEARDAELVELTQEANKARAEVQRLREKEREFRKENQRLRSALDAQAKEQSRPSDPVADLHLRIHEQWVRRVPESDKAQLLLCGYRFGPDFMESVAAIEGVTDEKLASVMMEVLTGLAEQMPGRQLHQYREGEAGGQDTVTHPFYGRLWRASIQVNTASARRLHFYRGKGGVVTFASVRVHDAAV